MASQLFRLTVWCCFVVSFCRGDVEWWQKGPIYQVYPASFADSNGDGWGDIRGITEHAEYFKDLGIEAVWLSPIFKSPMKDNGYDVSDYTDVNPIFGNMSDVRRLKDKLHSLGIKLMLDFVPNHSSDEHPWFKKSVDKASGFEDFYVWKEKSGSRTMENGTTYPLPPNNWRSLFTPSAWKWNEKRQQFYLHQFGEFQPDLNYNNPKVVDAMKDAMRFWLDMGVDGLRVDATPYLIETNYDKSEPMIPGCVSTNAVQYYECQKPIYTKDQPELYSIIEQFNSVLREYNTTKYQFIEAYTTVNNTMKYYMNSSSPFNFNLLSYLHFEAKTIEVKQAVDTWIDNMPKGSWPNWVMGNHDNARVATRMGEDMVDAMNTLVLLLPGTPITYMGEELGMTNNFVPENQRRDKSDFLRDPERTPMQWNSSYNAGFSSSSSPYLPINANYWHINAQYQNSVESSHLSVYKKLVALHRELVTEGLNDFKTFAISERIFGFSRPNHLILINFDNEEKYVSIGKLELPKGKTDSFRIKVPSANFNGKIGDHVDYGITMSPRSSVVLTITGFACNLRAPTGLAVLIALLSVIKSWM